MPSNETFQEMETGTGPVKKLLIEAFNKCGAKLSEQDIEIHQVNFTMSEAEKQRQEEERYPFRKFSIGPPITSNNTQVQINLSKSPDSDLVEAFKKVLSITTREDFSCSQSNITYHDGSYNKLAEIIDKRKETIKFFMFVASTAPENTPN